MTYVKTICNIVVRCLYIVLMVSLCSASTTDNGRWENPCVGTSLKPPISASQFGNLFNNMVRITEPLVDTLRRTLRNIREGQTLAENLKQRIFNESIQNEQYRRFLDVVHFEGFPSLENVSESEVLKNITETNIVNFDKLARAAVFIEQSRSDEVSCDDPMFKDDVINNENKLYSVMCNIEKAIENEEGTINGGVSRDIMSNDLRTSDNEAGRRERDYIIFKDVNTLYKILIDQYTKIISHLVTQI